MKRFFGLLLTLIIIILLCIAFYFRDRLHLIPSYFESGHLSPATLEDESKPKISFEERVKEAKAFIKENKFDETHAVFIDFSEHSGKNRFFVWNFLEEKIEIESLVAHGYGNKGFESTNQNIVFSNTPNSFTSSLGKYKIGIRAPSQWGINIHYKLHGLEESNSNAYSRYIVLHSFGRIPESEIFPSYLPLGYSQGCPVIDDETMRKMDKLLQTKTKPVLLWAYYLE